MTAALFERSFVRELARRFDRPPAFMQVLAGPRQVGKTTGVRQLIAQSDFPAHYANADDVLVSDRSWLLRD
jgi:predicted AAA+ superfamily ATPase